VAPSTRSDGTPRAPRIDVVLQATGSHAHAASHGIVNALSRIDLLGRVFRPRADWGQAEPSDDDGLFDYLAAPGSEFILFLGFDWHSQALHTSDRWRLRIRMSPCVKVGYLHETLQNGTEDERREKLRALMSCQSLVNVIWHASPAEAEYIETLIERSRPVVASDFAVDTNFFECRRPQSARSGFAFFRGKLKPFTHPSQYQERRELVAHLTELGLVDVKTYDPAGFGDDQLVDEYNGYRICIDPPSVFAGPTTRVYEALACGCVVFSHRRNFSDADTRKLAPMLRTFESKEDLARQLMELRGDRGVSAVTEGRLDEIREAISLDVQMRAMVDQWRQMLPQVSLSAPVVRIFDHPYHAVTKSQKFLFDHFSDLNTVSVMCDTDVRAPMVYDSPTYQWGCYLELAWQTVHIYPHFDRAGDRKRVLFPMFDGSNHRPDESFPSAASYVSFSRTLHERLQRIGRDSTLIRYFPDSGLNRASIERSIERTEQRRAAGGLKAYFWQRTSEITFRTAINICKQLSCSELIVNVHGDPGQNELDTVQDGTIDGILVRTHGWLASRADALALVDDCDVYIAPRSCEGIGMGFLEAMSRGLCVVAFDAPTMNEYITDGVNGLIYRDINQPQLRENVDVAALRRKAADDATPMHATWQRQLDAVLQRYHPFQYSPPLQWLRERGVKFQKHFDFKILLDPVST
jgi:glycosyltransferase involved in cell wall biosynthesis